MPASSSASDAHREPLSIVRRAVPAMGGDVSASAPPCGDAAVHFTPPDPLPAAAESRHARLPPADG